MSDLRSLFRRRPAPLLGLDLGVSSVRLVELGRDGGGLALERCASEPLALGWVTDGQIEKFDEVAAAVRRVVHKSGARTRNVALALPSSAVITRKIVLSGGGMNEQELERQVESEVRQYIPSSLDEVCLDFSVIGSGAALTTDFAGDIEVLIAASRRDKVQDRQGLAEAAGLKAVVLDVESHASRRAAARWIERWPGQGRDVVVALFEVGASAARMQVLRNAEVLYERDQALGSDPSEADRVREIGRALEFFFTSTPYHRVDHVLFAGDSAPLSGLADAVAWQMSCTCSVVNPFDGMAGVHRAIGEASSYMVACGLAMRRFLP